MNLARGIKTWIATLSTLPGYTDYRPDTPADLITVREYGGGMQVRGTSTLQRPVQLLFRAGSAATAHDAAWAVYRALLPIPPVISAEGGRFIVSPQQAPFFLERDASERSTYVFNVAIYAAPDS